MVKISNRLIHAAALVTGGNRLADIGTDHGYIPIYLIEQKRIPSAIAMDINEGPLERAKEHILLYGMGDYIQTRLSDGAAALKPGEADSILIAGMGGGLVMHILSEGREVCRSAGELILQPQSELERVREFLTEEGYEILAEDMVLEEDKFYPMMRVSYNGSRCICNKVTDLRNIKSVAEKSGEQLEKQQSDTKLSNLYGGLLLKNQHPVLKEYLLKEEKLYQEIYTNLKKNPASDKVTGRLLEVEEILENNKKALAYYAAPQKN